MALNYILIGKRIREIRKQKKMSQSALSDIVDRTPTYISYIESGIKGMSIETLVSIANALEVTVDIILADNINGLSISCEFDVAEILKNCSAYERSMIITCMKDLKAAMRDNHYLMKNHLG